MAEAAAQSTDDETRLKCKKCREILVRNPPHSFIDSTEEENIFTLSDESIPDWIETTIQQGGWTKGKLLCPGCGVRVGGFDYVSGVNGPLYIVKSKVDFWSPVPVAQLVEPKGLEHSDISPVQSAGPVTGAELSGDSLAPHVGSQPRQGSGVELSGDSLAPHVGSQPRQGSGVELSGDSLAPQGSQPCSGSGVEELMEQVYRTNIQEATVESTSGQGRSGTSSQTQTTPNTEQNALSEDDDDISLEVDTESTSNSNHTDHESSDDEDGAAFRSRRQLEKEIRRKRRKEREKSRMKSRQTDSQRVEAKVRELLEAEPELEELPDDVICPVCLDLLHEPFQTEPCRHIFCEPCLRRLGQKNPMNTKCPLCRTRIRFCKHIAATSREIRENHEAIYLRRKKFERSTPVYSYPLPWTPGWRNLLRGRPLGGNRLLVDEDNHAEYIRTILHQVPYYIPPIMFANIINILIFGFMIGLVEILPTVLFSLLGSSRNPDPAANLTDLAVPDISGDSLDVAEDGQQQPTLQVIEDAPGLVAGDVGAEAVDSTFYFILFMLSLIAAGVGQLILNQDQAQGGRAGYRLTDIMLVICLSSLPLFIIPTILPYRNTEGPYLGLLLKKLINIVANHFSFHTVLLAVVLACFVYNYDGMDQILA